MADQERRVTTQAELDQAITDKVPRIVVLGGTPGNRLVVSGNSSVEAWENSSVEAWANSSVVARENSSVVAWGNSSVVAWGNSSVVARENSSVVARGNSSVVARENSSVVAWEHSSVVAWEHSSVEAWANSSVVARENSSVVAWGNSSVVAWGNSSVEAWANSSVEAWANSSVVARENSSVVAWGNSSVVAWGNSSVVARGNSSVVARGNSSVVAGKWTAVHKMRGHVGSIEGGVVIQQPTIRTPQDWCDYYGVTVTDGVALVFKGVNREYQSPRGTAYIPLMEVAAPDWDGGAVECGEGLHFSPAPALTHEFLPTEWLRDRAVKYVACGVRLKDMAVHPDGQYPNKCKASKCLVLYECDRRGEPVTGDPR